MVNKQNLSKLGIGAWGIGGFAEKNPNNNDERQIKALAYQLSEGINFVVVNFWNAEGHSVELLKQAIDKVGVDRDDLFIVQALYNYNLDTIEDVKREVERCLEKFETSYIDSIEFPLTAFGKYGFKKLVKLVERYLIDGKARYTSVTNFNLEYLKKYHKIFKDKLFSHELCYSFEIRENEELGIIDYARKNDIINVPYQPLRRNRTAKRNWPLLVELSGKYEKTQNQVILNWLTSKVFYPLVKSETISHIDENLAALEFKMDKKDINRLDSFRVQGYKMPKIDWWMTGEGVFVHALPNIFDENYPEN